MPDIKYVCLTDTHFGEEDSLLTNLKTASSETDPSQPSPVLEHLVECLRVLIEKNEEDEKPILVLAGDILELALTTTNQAAMAFERFIELVMPKDNPLFERIIYVPGNHDHHLWESGRETQYVDFIEGIQPSDKLPIPWHTTNIFVENDPNPLPCYFLTRLVNRYPHLQDAMIQMAYPNFGIYEEDGQRCVIFHHGHFIEPLYQLMSTIKSLIFSGRDEPTQIWDIEAENFAWIDFFWSTMGRSGEAGTDIELIYEKMHDRDQFKKLLNGLAKNLAEKYDLPGWGDWMERKLLEFIFGKIVDKALGTERTKIDRPLSEEAEKGMRKYVEGPLRNQAIKEGKESLLNNVTFVFGHTHKPFQEDMNFNGYPTWVNVYNTGGWVVESVDPQIIHGGAIILVDEDLNAVSLRMYNEVANHNEYQVKVEEATRAGQTGNPLFVRIKAQVNPSQLPWNSFSRAVARAVHVRAQNLRTRIYSN